MNDQNICEIKWHKTYITNDHDHARKYSLCEQKPMKNYTRELTNIDCF